MARSHDLSQIGRILQERFERRGVQLTTDLERAMFLGATKVKADSQRLSPTKSGMLRNSIGVRNISGNGKIGFEVGTRVSYARFVHEGTGKFERNGNGRNTPWVYHKNGRFFWTQGQEANPFMEKAMDNNRDQIIRLIQNAIRGGM